MLVFILIISCLTTSNFPWFMDLTFQVPIQYCFLQHWILLSSLDTSTTECCIHYDPASSFILGLLVILPCSSPVAYWTLRTWGTRCHIFLAFYTVQEVLTASILGWFAIPFSSGSHFVRTFCSDPSVLGGPAWHDSLLHWVTQAHSPSQGSDTWRGMTGLSTVTLFV